MTWTEGDETNTVSCGMDGHQRYGKVVLGGISYTVCASAALSLIHIYGEVWHLDVGSSHPGAEFGPKGSAVRRLKWYASWVQNLSLIHI